MIEIYRPGEEIGDFGDAASEVAIRTAALGGPYPLCRRLRSRASSGPSTPSILLPIPTARRVSASASMRAFGEPRLAITGWHCRAALEIVDRSVIACALERLSLVMAASEPKVTELFARAEPQRKRAARGPACWRGCRTRSGTSGLRRLRCRNAWPPRREVIILRQVRSRMGQAKV